MLKKQILLINSTKTTKFEKKRENVDFIKILKTQKKNDKTNQKSRLKQK